MTPNEQIKLYYKPVGNENFDKLKVYMKGFYFVANAQKVDEYTEDKYKMIDELRNEPGEYLGMLRGLHPNLLKPIAETLLEHDPPLFINIMFRWDSMVFGDNLNPFKEVFNYYGVNKED